MSLFIKMICMVTDALIATVVLIALIGSQPVNQCYFINKNSFYSNKDYIPAIEKGTPGVWLGGGI